MAVNKSKIVEQAQKYTAKGQFDKAIVEYQRVVKVDPADIRTWLKIGDLYTRKGSRKEATETYLKVADHYTKSGFYLKAVAVYKQILKIDPTLLEVHELLAKSYLDLGLSSEALIQLEQLADMYQRTGRNREMLSVLLRMGEIDPHNIATRLRIAEHLSKEERIPEAVEHFTAACGELRVQGRADDYVKVAERLLYHDSTRVDVAREVARIYVERGQYKRALSRLQLCFVKDSRDLPTLELLARAFHGLEQPEKAISVYREMATVQKDRGDQSAYAETMGRILSIDPDDAMARNMVESAGLRLPSQSPDRHVAGAQPQDGLWSPADALAESGDESPLGSSSAIQILDTESQSGVSRLEHDTNEMAGAQPQQLSEAAIDERTKKMIGEADVLLKYGLKERACEHLRRIFDLDPYHIDAREKLKDLLIELDAVDEAIDQLFLLADVFKESQPEGSVYYLHEVLKISPTNSLARQMLEELGGVMPEEVDDDVSSVTAEDATFVGARVLVLDDEPSVAELELEEIDDPLVGLGEPVALGRKEHENPEGGYEPTLKDIPYVGPDTGPLDIAEQASVSLSDFAALGTSAASVVPTPPSVEMDQLSGDVMVEEDDGEDEEEVLFEEEGFEEVVILEEDSKIAELPILELDEELERNAYDDYLMGRAPEEELPNFSGRTDSEPPTTRHPIAGLLAEKEALRAAAPRSSLPPLPHPSVAPSLSRMHSTPPSDLAEIDSWETPPTDLAAAALEHDPPTAPMIPLPPGSLVESDDSVEFADLSAETAEVEFFLDQELFEEAAQILDELDAEYPNHPMLASLRARIPGGSGPAVAPLTVPPPAQTGLSSDGLFDPADLVDDLSEEMNPLGSESLDQHASGQFRVEVKEHVEESDFATHFDLGMAYKEMGLADEATREFQVAARDPARSGQAKMMIGLCQLAAGQREEAIKVFDEALRGNSLSVSDRMGILYELGKIHEESSRRDLALRCYEEIVCEDPAFADVVERINRLQ